MRASQYLLATLKEVPKNCTIISHKLMLRAGLIRQISSGIYIWLPTGLRVLQKIKNVVREEMKKIDFIEISMPITQPAKLWSQSGRLLEYGTELLHFENRNKKKFVLGPTHEEMVSTLICKEMKSHKQFPVKIYQINTKYRDEARPRFGIIRSREFIMKDGYSFHTNQSSLQDTYRDIYFAYCVIFNRIGINFCIVQSEPGKMGGTLSHEFQAYSKNGEDIVASSSPKNSAVTNHIDHINNNFKIQSKIPTEKMRIITAPHIYSIETLVKEFNLSLKKIVKIIIIRSKHQNNNKLPNLIRLAIRADHQLSYKKIAQISYIPNPISLLRPEEFNKITGTEINILGSINNTTIPLIIDYKVAIMHDFVAGSDIHGKYFFGVNWNRDIPLPKIADLHTKHNDTEQCTNNILSINNTIEIGHIFQLGQKYTDIVQNHTQKNNNNNRLMIKMGCYGIGITRIIAAIIEQNYDKNGIIWPEIIAPFKIAIIPINIYYSINVKKTAEKLYNQIQSIINTHEILMYDKKEYPGTIFANIDLIGIPHIIIISDRKLTNKEVEYKNRKTNLIKNIKIENIMQFLTEKLVT